MPSDVDAQANARRNSPPRTPDIVRKIEEAATTAPLSSLQSFGLPSAALARRRGSIREMKTPKNGDWKGEQ